MNASTSSSVAAKACGVNSSTSMVSAIAAKNCATASFPERCPYHGAVSPAASAAQSTFSAQLLTIVSTSPLPNASYIALTVVTLSSALMLNPLDSDAGSNRIRIGARIGSLSLSWLRRRRNGAGKRPRSPFGAAVLLRGSYAASKQDSGATPDRSTRTTGVGERARGVCFFLNLVWTLHIARE